MSQRVKREELLQILGRVQPGLSARDFIEQSTCFIFNQGWVSTFNDEICCRTKTGLEESLVGAVNAKKLLQVVENIGDDEIDLNSNDKELIIKSKSRREKAGIRLEQEIVLPVDEIEAPDKGQWVDLPENFNAAIKQVIGAAGSDDEEFLTVCIHVTPDYMEASDRKQFTRYTIKTGATKNFLVRAKSISPIIPLELTKFGETENWVHFRNKSLIYSCRRHVEDYPTDQITMAMDAFKGSAAVLPRGALPAAKLAGTFSMDDRENDKVKVKLSDGKMIVRGEGTVGWAEREIEMSYHGPDVSFRISPTMLIQLVKDHTDCEIGPGRLRVKGENWVYLTVLGKDEDKKEPITVPADDESGSEEKDDGDED